MQPLISIIVPVYKVEKYLRRCVDSLLTQKYESIEVILVDDGSPDRCGDICDEYACKDNRIQVIHKTNGGLSDARNVAIPIAKGEYISFVDSDDWVSSYYISNLYGAACKRNADIAISWFENVFENKEIQSSPIDYPLKAQYLTVEGCLKRLLYQEGVETSAWGKLYKANLIRDLRYPVEKLYEDIPVTYEVVKRSKVIALVENVDYYYYQRADSIQNKHFNTNKMDGVMHCRNMMESIKREFPELGKAAECRYFSTVCNILFQIKDNEHNKEKAKLWREIDKYRKSVLFNAEARKIGRASCRERV